MDFERLYEDIILYLYLAGQAEKDIADFTGTKVGETFRAILDKKVKRQGEDKNFWYFFHGIGFSVEYKEKNFELAYDYSIRESFDVFYGNKAWFTIDDNPHIFQTRCEDNKIFKYYLDQLVAQGKLQKENEDGLYSLNRALSD